MYVPGVGFCLFSEFNKDILLLTRQLSEVKQSACSFLRICCLGVGGERATHHGHLKYHSVKPVFGREVDGQGLDKDQRISTRNNLPPGFQNVFPVHFPNCMC